jgi:hypothetical protein
MYRLDDCFLGGVRLGLPQGDEPWRDSHKEEVSLWESMINHLGIIAEFTVPLRKSMTSVKKYRCLCFFIIFHGK